MTITTNLPRDKLIARLVSKMLKIQIILILIKIIQNFTIKVVNYTYLDVEVNLQFVEPEDENFENI